jgi:hypothetical protein
MKLVHAILACGLMLFSTIALTGCASGGGRGYVASQLTAPAFGRTALVIRPQNDGNGWHSPKTTEANIHAAMADVLNQVPGTSLTDLSPSIHTTNLSDYELVMAARRANARTVCVVTVQSIGSRVCLGIAIPPLWAGTFADYNIRLLDVTTGKLLVDTARHDQTYTFYCPPEHALLDMQRGFRAVLKRGGLLAPS